MPKLEKYGKSSVAVIAQKNSFFEDNSSHLNVERKIAKVYAQQPLREHCKNCDAALSKICDFFQAEVGYIFCEQCGHLNGQFEDSDAFCHEVYTGDEGASYGLNYSTKDREAYYIRMESIYLPKATFLLETLKNDNSDTEKLSYVDFGAGSGYFVSALKQLGLDVRGYEISPSQVAFANAVLEDILLTLFEPQETATMISKLDCKVISMIGVLEHLQEPRVALEAIKKNENIEYFYISVPLFSMAVFLEKLSPEIFSRQLSGGHTHLYTQESLNHMLKEFGFESIGEWWFGSEMMDLHRHVSVMLGETNASEKMKKMWQSSFTEIIDALQLEIDKKHMSSEVHMVLKKI